LGIKLRASNIQTFTVHRQHEVHAGYKHKTNNVSNYATLRHATLNYSTLEASYK